MTTKEVLKELKGYADEKTRAMFIKHGAPADSYFGVKVQDLKKIQKKVKKDHSLSLELYDSGNTDAMYLAGLIADEDQITRKDLQRWVKAAPWSMISEYTVPWVAAESPYGWELGLKWIESKKEHIAAAGWSTLGSVASLKSDDELDIDAFRALLDRVEKTIHKAQNRTRYTMNNFVIAVGSYIPALTKHAMKVGEKVGKVHVDQGGTACKVPKSTVYIQKVIDKGRIGKKRKSARC